MLRGRFVRDIQQPVFRVPKIVIQRVVHHHADEAADDDRRIDLDERAVALPFAQVGAEKLVNLQNKLVEEHLRQLVLFERRVEQQTLKLRIAVVVIERAERKRFKNATIVLALNRIRGDLGGFKRAAAFARLMIENRGVKLFFRGEMAKHHRLGDACCLRDFLGCGAAKASIGKEADGDSQDLVVAFFARHPAVLRGKRIFCRGVDLLAHFAFCLTSQTRLRLGQSKYLLTIQTQRMSRRLY